MSTPSQTTVNLDALKARKLSTESAWFLALASKAAAEPTSVAGELLSAWGFESGEFFEKGANGFLAAAGDVIVIAFAKDVDAARATEQTVVSRPNGEVDAAAFAAYEEVSNLLQTALGILKAGQKAIWLTGHGMGGAIALIAASELDAQFPVAGIHTYNPSCAGKIQFADWFDATFLGRSYRFEATGDRIFSVAPGFRQVQQLVRLDLGDTDDQGGAEGNLANLRSLDRYIERLGAQVETERVRRRANAPVRGGEFGTADESR